MQTTEVLGSGLSTQQHVSTEWLLAKGVSIIFSPPLLGILGLMMVGFSLNSAQGWAWLSIYAALNIVSPVIYLVMLMRRGEVSDFHMKDRLERFKPLRAVLLLFFLSWLVFLASSAPPLFQVLALIGTLQSAAIYLITLRWKISGHGAGVAGFSVLLWGLYGAVAAPAFLFIPLVIWARVRLERHDLAQTLAGALLGSAVMFLAINSISNLL